MSPAQPRLLSAAPALLLYASSSLRWLQASGACAKRAWHIPPKHRGSVRETADKRCQHPDHRLPGTF